MKKILCTILLIISSFFNIFAFENPSEHAGSQDCVSYFGQNRGNLLSTSLIFKDIEDVKASEDGNILIIISDYEDDNDFFPSSLGNCVILSHEDNLASVYANLDSESLTTNSMDNHKVAKETVIGTVGNSGFQENQSGLEFQILDLKNSTAINPKILLPHDNHELPLTLAGILLKTKNNVYYDLNSTRVFSAGTYQLYQTRNKIAVPYSTAVSVDGILMDSITTNLLSLENEKISLNGKQTYDSKSYYPDESLELLGEITVSPGKSILKIEITDILNNIKQLNYNISIY